MFLISATNLALLVTLASHVLATLKGHSFSLMPLGDSITWGTGSSDGNGYRGNLLWALGRYGARVDFIGSQHNGKMNDNNNEGYPGRWIHDIQGFAETAHSHGYDPKVILLHAGTNDCQQNPVSGDDLRTRLETLTRRLTNLWPRATVIVASIISSTDGNVNANVQKLNAQIPGMVQRLAGQGMRVAHADMSKALTPADMYDKLHPNDKGYVKMSHVWLGALDANSGKGWY
ncbi:hypothetical protein CKM354_001086700 [Cercospora kikuchii]|uniref:SGNH hydrolase-type esterase domain-containing protein n=1 Tax=Cercospora kikuchii TaxID=84275 RepID=A0A9P3CNG9_9PEZI|nr:uncharacterized protein CKM354_001086700 [Cercospora kikuchii]GIZ47784.1 hypothetical protein CKM354_001086700 [Cercospora kikuchii]